MLEIDRRFLPPAIRVVLLPDVDRQQKEPPPLPPGGASLPASSGTIVFRTRAVVEVCHGRSWSTLTLEPCSRLVPEGVRIPLPVRTSGGALHQPPGEPWQLEVSKGLVTVRLSRTPFTLTALALRILVPPGFDASRRRRFPLVVRERDLRGRLVGGATALIEPQPRPGAF